MPTNEDRHARWFAYCLGELPETERAEVEAEMAAAPEDAEHVRRVCAGVESWAAEEIDSTPLNIQAVYQSTGQFGRGAVSRRSPRVLTKAWPWAAAAAFLIALSQISFSIHLGDSVIAWGQAAPSTDAPETPELLERLAAIETATTATREEVAGVVEQAAALETELRESTAELAYNQQLESQARYSDIQRILSMSGLGNYSMTAYYEP